MQPALLVNSVLAGVGRLGMSELVIKGLQEGDSYNGPYTEPSFNTLSLSLEYWPV